MRTIIKLSNRQIIKSIIISILTNCLIITCAISQVYNSIPFGNTKCHSIKYAMSQPSKSYCFYSKDTTGYYNGGKKYWKVEFLQSSTYTTSTNGVYIFDDTSLRMVSIIDTNTNSTYLLYDFSASTNDTLHNLYNNIDGSIVIDSVVIIDSIKYITYNSTSRKTIFVHGSLNSVPQIWIEGIGANNLLQPSFHPPILEFTWNLTCQEYNSNLTYGEATECNNFLTSTTHTQKNEPILTLTSNYQTLTIQNPTSTKYTLQIFNLNGQTIYTTTSNYLIQTINLPNQQNNILIYNITTTQNQQTRGKIYVE